MVLHVVERLTSCVVYNAAVADVSLFAIRERETSLFCIFRAQNQQCPYRASFRCAPNMTICLPLFLFSFLFISKRGKSEELAGKQKVTTTTTKRFRAEALVVRVCLECCCCQVCCKRHLCKSNPELRLNYWVNFETTIHNSASTLTPFPNPTKRRRQLDGLYATITGARLAQLQHWMVSPVAPLLIQTRMRMACWAGPVGRCFSMWRTWTRVW